MTTKRWLTPSVIKGFAEVAFNISGAESTIDRTIAERALSNIMLNGQRANSDELWQALRVQHPKVAEDLQYKLPELSRAHENETHRLGKD